MDNIDLLILKEFCCLKENEYFTIWDLMKKLYPQAKTKKERDKKYDFLKKRIKEGQIKVFFFIEPKRGVYTLKSDKVYYKKFTFKCGRKLGIEVLNENKSIIFEL